LLTIGALAAALAEHRSVADSLGFAAAVAEFVAKHKASKVSERLDAVYAAEESRLDAATSRSQRKVIRRAEW
jgi:sugar/nucleoside kinase (ribokinase family)